jgi:MFS family permease
MSELSAPHTKSRNFCLPIQRQLNPSTIRFARAATYAIFFGDGLGFGVWTGHIPIFKQKFHLGDAQLSVALFAVALGAIVAMPIVGHTLRRFGSRALTGFCASLYAIAIACLAHAPSYPLFVLGAALLGACKGSLDVSINAQAVGVESAYGRPIMSSFQAAWSVGGLAGAALAGAALRSGLVAEENLAAAGAFILAIAFTEWANALISAVLSVPYLIRERAAGQTSSLAWPDKALLSVAAFTFLALFSEGTMADWSGVYLRTVIGVPVSTAALGYATYSLAMAGGRFLGDRLLSALGPILLLRFSGLSAAAGLALALLIRRPEVVIAGFILVGFGLSNLVPILFGSAGRHKAGVGPGIAAVTTIGYFGFLVGPPLIGTLASLFSLPAALSLVIVFGLIIANSARHAVAGPQIRRRQPPDPVRTREHLLHHECININHAVLQEMQR